MSIVGSYSDSWSSTSSYRNGEGIVLSGGNMSGSGSVTYFGSEYSREEFATTTHPSVAYDPSWVFETTSKTVYDKSTTRVERFSLEQEIQDGSWVKTKDSQRIVENGTSVYDYEKVEDQRRNGNRVQIYVDTTHGEGTFFSDVKREFGVIVAEKSSKVYDTSMGHGSYYQNQPVVTTNDYGDFMSWTDGRTHLDYRTENDVTSWTGWRDRDYLTVGQAEHERGEFDGEVGWTVVWGESFDGSTYRHEYDYVQLSPPTSVPKLNAPGRVTEIGSGEIATETPLLLPNQGAMFSVPDEVRRPPVERSWFDWLKATAIDATEIGLGKLQDASEIGAGVYDSVTFGLGQVARDAAYGALGYEYEYGVGHAIGEYGTDAAGLIIPGIGVAKIGAKKLLKEGAEQAIKHLDDAVKHAGEVKDAKKTLQLHHFSTNKHSIYTPQFKKITDKYDLNLNGAWNKEVMEHIGRHTHDYHDEVLQKMREIDAIAKGNKEKFLELYEIEIKKWVLDKPEVIHMKKN